MNKRNKTEFNLLNVFHIENIIKYDKNKKRATTLNLSKIIFNNDAYRYPKKMQLSHTLTTFMFVNISCIKF
jgi:hypothetical protein